MPATTKRTESQGGTVPTDPSTNPVDQPIDLLAIRPAHTTCNTVCIWARPIDLQVNLLFNRPQGLDYTWPRFGSASQVCFENSPALRTLTTSTFKSEEEEEKGSLPACPSWVVSACLATYISHVRCVSNPSMPEVVFTPPQYSPYEFQVFRILRTECEKGML